MAKTKPKWKTKTSKFGISYNTRYYTEWNGLVVSKKHLSEAKKSGKVSKQFIKSIRDKNEDVLKTSGNKGKYGEDVYKTLKKKAEISNNSLKNLSENVGKDLRSGTFLTKEERISVNLKKIARGQLTQEERYELQKFMGWKGGFNLEKAGFKWNKENKRFEKEVNVDGITMLQWIKIDKEKIGKDSKNLMGAIYWDVER